MAPRSNIKSKGKPRKTGGKKIKQSICELIKKKKNQGNKMAHSTI